MTKEYPISKYWITTGAKKLERIGAIFLISVFIISSVGRYIKLGTFSIRDNLLVGSMFVFLYYAPKLITNKFTDHLRIVDNTYLEYLDGQSDSAPFYHLFMKNERNEIKDITEMFLMSIATGDASIGVARMVNGKEVLSCMTAVNRVYGMKTISEFLNDITKINPTIKLDKDLEEYKANPEATFRIK